MEEGKVLGSPTPLQKKGGKHSFMWVLVLGVAVIVALAVGLSLGLKDDSDNNGNLQSYANNGKNAPALACVSARKLKHVQHHYRKHYDYIF